MISYLWQEEAFSRKTCHYTFYPPLHTFSFGCGSFGTTPVAVSIMQPELRRTGSRGYVDIPVYDGTPNSHLYPCWNEVSES